MRCVPNRSVWLTFAALVPPGYGVFVVLCAMASAGAGVLVAMVSEAASTSTLAAYAIVGTGYGLALWFLAHYGYLPFPEPE